MTTITGRRRPRRALPDRARPATARTRSTGATTRRPTSSCAPTTASTPAPASRSPTAGATRSPARPSGRWRSTWSAATLEEIAAEPVAFWRSLTADLQLRWLGPEKGVIHMATGGAGQRGLGPAGQAGRQADVAAARRDADRRAGAPASTSAHHRRASPRTRRRRSWTRAPAGYADGWPSWSATASRPTPPRSAGSATRTRRCGR